MLKAQIGEGVWLLTKDSLFSMNIRPRVQLRALSSNEVRQTEFEEEIFARRMRLWTAGHLFSPKLTYLFQLHFVEFDVLPQRIEETDFNRRPIRDLIVQYNLSPATWISFGQTKLPHIARASSPRFDCKLLSVALTTHCLTLTAILAFKREPKCKLATKRFGD